MRWIFLRNTHLLILLPLIALTPLDSHHMTRPKIPNRASSLGFEGQLLANFDDYNFYQISPTSIS
jgi:hypothetical protein